MKRTLVFILVCAFLVALFPISAFASSASSPIGMSMVAPAWWAFISSVGVRYVADGLSSLQLGDFLSEKITSYIGTSMLDALIGDGLSFDGGEFQLQSSVANLFRSWLSDLLTSEDISTVPKVVSGRVFAYPTIDHVLSSDVWFYGSYGGTNSDYRVFHINSTIAESFTVNEYNNGLPASISLNHSANPYFVFPSSNSIAGQRYLKVQFYSSIPQSSYAIENNYNQVQWINCYVNSSVPVSNSSLSLSVDDDFTLPDEFTTPVTITSPSLVDVSLEDVESAVYDSTVDNSFQAQWEETITRPIVDTIQGLFDGISNFWNELLEWIRSFWSNLTSTLENVISSNAEDPDTHPLAHFLEELSNISFSGIWHYILEWLGSIAPFLSLVLSIWNGLPFSFSIIVWAGLASLVIFGLLKRFLE